MEKRPRSGPPASTPAPSAARLAEITAALLESVRGGGGEGGEVEVSCDGSCGYYPDCGTAQK